MIREMKAEDVREMVEIENAIFSSPWSEKSFIDALGSQDTIYLVETFEEEIRGYCGIWIAYETADLCNMAVAAKYRRQGVADRLLQEMIERAKKRQVERILLEVRESNIGARALYQKQGFGKIGLRKRYYKEPEEDAVLMELQLVDGEEISH